MATNTANKITLRKGWNQPNVAVLQTPTARITSGLVAGYLGYLVVGSVVAALFAQYWYAPPCRIKHTVALCIACIQSHRLRSAVAVLVRYALGMCDHQSALDG